MPNNEHRFYFSVRRCAHEIILLFNMSTVILKLLFINTVYQFPYKIFVLGKHVNSIAKSIFITLIFFEVDIIR